MGARTNQLDKHNGHSGKGARPLLFAAVNMEVSHINTNMQLVDELCEFLHVNLPRQTSLHYLLTFSTRASSAEQWAFLVPPIVHACQITIIR